MLWMSRNRLAPSAPRSSKMGTGWACILGSPAALSLTLCFSVQLGVLEVVEKVEGEREEKPAAAEAEHDTIHE